MTQLDGDRIVAKRCSAATRGNRANPDSFLKLAGNWASSAPSLPARRQRIDRRAKLVDVRWPRSIAIAPSRLCEHLGVRELLIELQRELEVRPACARPTSRPSPAQEPGRTSSSPRRCRSVPRRTRARRTSACRAAGAPAGRDRKCRSTCPCRMDSSSPMCRRGSPAAAPSSRRVSPRAILSSLSKPKVTLLPRTRIGRLIRFGCCIIRSIASFLDLGSGRCLNTGLRVLTKSRKRCSSMCCSRNSRSGRILVDVDAR